MSKSVMRLTREGLRRLIQSEVRRVNEAAGAEDSELAEACAGASGKEIWDAQVEVAANRLTEELLDVIAPIVQKVEDDLINGEFYDEAQSMLPRGRRRR